jgi:hypothetical protein
MRPASAQAPGPRQDKPAHPSRQKKPVRKIVEGIFSVEVSRAYSTLSFRQEKSFHNHL